MPSGRCAGTAELPRSPCSCWRSASDRTPRCSHVVDKVLLQPLPYPEPDRLVQFIVASPMGNATLASVPKFIAWREGRGVFEHVAAFTAPEPIVLATGGPPELASGMQVSAGYFPVFGVVTASGRLFSMADDLPRGPRVAVISHGFWQRRLGRDTAALGRLVQIDGTPHEVVGVLAPNAPVDARTDVWMPSSSGSRQPRPLEPSSGGGTAPARRRGRQCACGRSTVQPASSIGDFRTRWGHASISASCGSATSSSAMRGRRCCSCWGRWRSSCSSRAPTSPTCCWPAAPPASASSRCARRSAPARRASSRSC